MYFYLSGHVNDWNLKFPKKIRRTWSGLNLLIRFASDLHVVNLQVVWTALAGERGGSWPLIPSKERIKKVDPPSAAQSLRFLRRYLHVFFCVTARHLSFYAYIHYVWLNLMWQPLGHWKLFHVWLNQSAASTGVITAAGNQSLKTVAYCVIP